MARRHRRRLAASRSSPARPTSAPRSASMSAPAPPSSTPCCSRSCAATSTNCAHALRPRTSPRSCCSCNRTAACAARRRRRASRCGCCFRDQAAVPWRHSASRASFDLPNAVGVDMGGTSYDVSLVRDDRIELVTQGEIDRLPVRVPMVEIRTIGAGGGSIARVLAGRQIKVGPESAGARPGPVCYGRGGTEPTVTDANLALGRLDAAYFLGGAMPLDLAAARNAIATRIAAPLGLDAGRRRRRHPAHHQHQSRRRHPRHAVREGPRSARLRAAQLRWRRVRSRLRRRRGTRHAPHRLSGRCQHAVGARHPRRRHRACLRPLGRACHSTPAALPVIAKTVARTATPKRPSASTPTALPWRTARARISLDLRYKGQAFEMTVPWEASAIDAAALVAVGKAVPRRARAALLLRQSRRCRRTRHAAPRCHRPPAARIGEIRDSAGERPSCRRRAEVYRRSRLGDRSRLAARRHRRRDAWSPGPAIVEEDYTTIYLATGWTLRRAADGHLVAETAGDDVMSKLDPIELEVLHNALTAAAADMDVTMWRTSRSTIVREMLDYSTAIFDADGFNVAQSARIPQHLNSMGYCLRTIVERFLPVERLARRRRRHHQRSLLRRPASARHRRLPPGVS